MRTAHNLDWMHVLLASKGKDAPKWSCTRKQSPRAWELLLWFRMISMRGRVTPNCFCVVHEELPGMDDPTRRLTRQAFNTVEMSKQRQFMHVLIEETAMRGRLGRTKFRRLERDSPIKGLDNITMKQLHDDFYLQEPTPDHPGSGVLTDKRTGAMVEFKVPVNPSDDQLRRIWEDALGRIYAINCRAAEVRKAHGSIIRPN